ncbi:MAG TPA: glucosaminidase domain-containing protein [Streptosporangiaceae bacterium]|nr:glucosaminidase domain-containing protein [Streptosporangiaceae bacterium]
MPKTKPTWQQATALVSLSTCGAMTGFAFAHGTVDEMTSPTRMPVKLMAVDKPAKPAVPEQTSDGALRSAIVKVAKNYLRMAQSKSPAEMQALIWGVDSVDGADHGESCAAFASLTLALGAQATGQQSWVTGGTTYPWPLRPWADVRVDLNPASPQIISVMQDAQAHHRWHPLGDGYHPRPGDWVMFDGHVEVVTGYSARALRTIGGDSAPNLSVNAHTFSGSLAAQGVTGFVNNGQLLRAVTSASGPSDGSQAGGSAEVETAGIVAQDQAGPGSAAVPGTAMASVSSRAAWKGADQGAAAREGATRMVGTAGRAGSPGTQGMVQMPGMMADFGTAPVSTGTGDGVAPAGQNASRANSGLQARHASQPRQASKARSASKARPASQARSAKGSGNGAAPWRGMASRDGNRAAKPQRTGTAAIPGLAAPSAEAPGNSSPAAAPSYTRNTPSAESTHVPGTAAQQAFISRVAPGAIAMQSRYGVPAAVTIAQAIDESGWGQSALAIRDHNLFGIKGSGPAGTDMLPTQEYQNGQYVTVTAPFRIYHNIAESIADHGKLLATSASYQHAMADRHLPDAFATDLTGVYATDPHYGSSLIAIMRLYNLYQFSAPPSAPAQHVPAQQAGAPQAAAGPAAPSASAAGPSASAAGASAAGSDQDETAGPTGAVSQGGRYDLGGIVDVGGPASHGRSASQSRPPSRAHAAGQAGAATIPGVLDAYQAGPARPAAAAAAAAPLAGASLGRQRRATRPAARVATRQARPTRYVPQLPRVVTTAFVSSAKEPLSRAEPLYDDVASRSGIRWQLLAACDWMQCQARPRYSPVYGEKLGTVNAGGTVYRTKSEALGQCASDLVDLAMAVYWIDITARRPLSVGDLAKVFAAFRWGGLLKLHGISAMEFPYSVAGLTEQQVKMRWPDIKDPNAPDKPGTRFRPPFGAVPAALCLGYPAIA